MPISDPPAEHGSDLKQAFLRHLPERIGAVEENWQSLVRDGWEPVKLTRLFQRIQDLAGAAGKFGLIQVSETVFSLELYFRTFLGNAVQPNPQQIDEVNGLIRNLKTAAEDVKRPLVDSILRTGERKTPVFLLRFSDKIVPGLGGALESLQCSARIFSRVEDLMPELERDPPAALVVDAQMLPSLKPLTKWIERLKAEHGSPPPLTVISGSSDLDTRLNAMRAGADAFFVAPVDAASVAARVKQLASPISRGPYRVMVVDDDAGQADFAAAILRKSDMETCTVTDPLRVLDTLDAFRPDLILMDLYMPGADGVELTSIIREQNEFVGVPIVFLSGEQDTDKQLDALSAGGDDFIAKPIRPRHLITTVKNRIQRARALQGQGAAAQTRRDPVTGLFNRRHFFECLDSALASSGAQPAARGVIYLELDRRDAIQEAIGIGQTDALLAEIGAFLAAHTEPQDVTARLGDSSFAILAKRPLDKDIAALAESLVTTVATARFQNRGPEASPTLSAGVCYFGEESDDTSALMNRATAACATARQAGGNRVEIHGQGAQEARAGASGGAPDLAAAIRTALRSDDFQVLFQPFVAPHDRRGETYQLVLRLRTETAGQVGPAEIMAAARPAGLSKEVDRWMTARALSVIYERRQTGSQAQLLISQSAESLADSGLVDWLRDELRRRQLVGTGLILEFNLVDVAADLKGAKGLFTDLAQMGVVIGLSRFGHNDASYKILRYLGTAYVKVVDKLLPADPKIVSSLVERVHELGAQVIVPPVDDPSQIGRQWLTAADLLPANATQRTPDPVARGPG